MKISISKSAKMFFEPETLEDHAQVNALRKVAVSYGVECFTKKDNESDLDKNIWEVSLETV